MILNNMRCGRLPKNQKKGYYGLKAFGLGLLVAIVIFLPFIIYDSGLFLYYGDFNVQQIPFYQMIHDSIRNGNLGWSNTTDLGANIIGSYAFYLIGSPFFWLTIPFPSEAVPYLIGPLLILKTACMSFTAYLFLRRYTYNKNYAVLGGLLYAFSGFTCFNIFFNHFHEGMIALPLLLYAIDELFYDNRRGLVAVAVFLSATMNYYFFVGQVVFAVVYWFVKIYTKGYTLYISRFLSLLLEAVIGLVMSAVVLVPAILCILENSRLENILGGWDALVYDKPQRYINIITAFLFPSELPAFPTMTPNADNKWGSLSGWLPLFGITGTVALLSRKKSHWLKKLLPIIIFIAFIPILNSSFQMFNSQYYARWMYSLVLMMCLATVISLEDTEKQWGTAIGVTTALTLLFTVAIGFMPTKLEKLDETTEYTYGLMKEHLQFWVMVTFAVISLGALAMIFALTKNKPKARMIVSIVLTCVISAGSTVYTIAMGKTHGYDSKNYMNALVINHKDDIDLPNCQNVRTDFYEMMDNSAMHWQIPSIQAFHSVVPGSVMDFYNDVGVNRDVASRPTTSEFALRSLTSTRWLIDYIDDSKSFANSSGVTAMPNWKYYDRQSKFDIWENENYIPMGFSYDNYITEKEYEDCVVSNRTKLMLKAMVLTDEQIAKYNIDKSKLIKVNDQTFTGTVYTEDCKNRNKQCCSSFEYTKTGFTAKIDRTKESESTLMFFSVPYESGWSAQVNGKAVDVEKVNIGFMAVEVPANKVCNIVFTYTTPGLKTGIMATCIAFVVFAVYLVFCYILCKKPIKQGRKYRIVYNHKTFYEKAIIKASRWKKEKNTNINKETLENDNK